MAFRVPLAPKNIVDNGKNNGKKKVRTLVPPTMDRSSLVEALRTVSDTYASSCYKIRVVEEDIVKPTSERVQMIYLMLLSVLFDINTATLHQVPFREIPHDYPELYEDFYYRRNFLNAMTTLMDVCLPEENDFNPKDVLEPNSKRVQRNLSAIINYIKFRDHNNREYKVEEYKADIHSLSEKIVELEIKCQEQHQDVVCLRQKKEREKEIESDLIAQLNQRRFDDKGVEDHVYTLEARLEEAKKTHKKFTEGFAVLSEESKRLEGRIEDLKLQIVKSPDELYQKVAAIDEHLQEANDETKETVQNAMLWESLAKKATQIPSMIESIIIEFSDLTKKVDEKSEMDSKYENLVNAFNKMKQTIREMYLKSQNLFQKVKLLAEERAGLIHDQIRRSTNSTCNTDLVKDMKILQSQVDKKHEMEREILSDIEQFKEQYTQYVKVFGDLDHQFEVQVKALQIAYSEYKLQKDTITSSIPNQ